MIAFYNFSSDDEWNKGIIFVGTLDEFNERWYLLVGSPLILAILLQIFTPHFGLIIDYMVMSFRRYQDRRFTDNMRTTDKVIQKEYEDLYSGPRFNLQIRFA